MCLKELCDEYVIIAPKQTESEKKHCVTAAYQTFGSKSLLHSGLMKNKIPFNAFFNVTARTSKAIKIT